MKKQDKRQPNSDANRRIWELRREIDQIDQNILHYLNSRRTITDKLIAFKKESGLPVSDPGREEEMINNLKEVFEGKIDPELIENIYKLIIDDSKKGQ